MYRMVQDQACHWYIIPIDKDREFDDWSMLDSDEVPDYALEIDGPHRIAFHHWAEK